MGQKRRIAKATKRGRLYERFKDEKVEIEKEKDNSHTAEPSRREEEQRETMQEGEEEQRETMQEGEEEHRETMQEGEEINTESREEQEDEEMSQAEAWREEEKDSAEGTEPLQPLKMYFSPAYYTHATKIATFCFIHKVVNLINKLDPDERRWFYEHPQFRHFFHMPLEENHRMQGMSMLILRTACTEKKKECWFVVNGVPVRYSLREHALISGMYCHPYPSEYQTMGSLEFVERHFPGVKRVTYNLVEKKIESMGRCVERLNMAVLYFLSSVIIGKKKKGVGAPSVEPFFLRAASDLELCKTFPWGIMAFDANMADIFHMLDHMNGVL